MSNHPFRRVEPIGPRPHPVERPRLPGRRAGGMVLASILLVGTLAACGSDSKAGTDTTDDTVTPASVAPAKSFTLDEPVRLVGLMSCAGQDPQAVPDLCDGVRMAVEEINAAGGIGGHPVEFDPIVTPPYGDITNQFNEAVEKSPDVILGPVSATPLLTITKRIAEAGIPVIHAGSDESALVGGENGNEWMFTLRPLPTLQTGAAADYIVTELKPETVGGMYINAVYGTNAIKVFSEELGAAGLKIDPSQAFDPAATDLTKEVQAMKGRDVVIDWGTPASMVTSTQAFAQQGLNDIPRMASNSIGFSYFYAKGVDDPSLLDNMYGPIDCNPVGSTEPDVVGWVARYQKEFGYLPSYSSASMYDAVYMVRSVIEDSEDASPASIAAGLRAVDHDGICAEYSNPTGNQALMHSTEIVRFQDGLPVTVKTYDLTETP